MDVQTRLLLGKPAPSVAVKIAKMEELIKAFEETFKNGGDTQKRDEGRGKRKKRGEDLMPTPK